MKIKITEIIKTEFALSSAKGEEVFKEIEKNINTANTITLDFKGVSNVTTAFLDRAIGNLYNQYDTSLLKNKIKYEGLDELDTFLLNKVISLALRTTEEKGVETMKESIIQQWRKIIDPEE